MTDRTLDRRPAHAHHLISEALDSVGYLISRHGLYANKASVTPNGSRYDFGTDTERASLPGIRLELTATEFLAWCDILNAPRVGVARRAGRTELSADLHHDDCAWRLSTTISHTKGSDRLPGARIVWERNEHGRRLADGYTTVADLRNALAALGYRHENESGEIVAVQPHGPTSPQIVRYGYSALESPSYPNRRAVPCTDCGVEIPAGTRPPVWTDDATTCPGCTDKRRANA